MRCVNDDKDSPYLYNSANTHESVGENIEEIRLCRLMGKRKQL